MHAKITATRRFRVTLLTADPRGTMAAGLLARAAGCREAEAAARLAAGPGVLAEGLDRAEARRLARLLGLFGLRVATDAQGQAPAAVRHDLALQWRRADAPGGAAVLAARLGWPVAAVEAAMARPEGLVLRALDTAALDLCRQALAGLDGLRMLASDPDLATFDLVPSDRGALSPALVLHLRHLGIRACRMTGAVGAGLDRAMRDQVLRRFPADGAIALNRDFQRFDVLLFGTGGLSAREIEGFLRTRGEADHLVGIVGRRAVGRDHPLRIEQGLGRADAIAFQADYAAIGLETRLRLVRTEVARAA